ncbi:unnamed protein product [Darwinula stevensoni]|uniref:Limulus clotting factor C n=1 Tax=Darwinula stevensoni TaxID=69355 RepID=A0A7R8X5G6_9CRUS|nr:unnamed protein product [Darwinula stevensoni]CAG0884647.1 unnamed protein product [Darwinula stevensoni]
MVKDTGTSIAMDWLAAMQLTNSGGQSARGDEIRCGRLLDAKHGSFRIVSCGSPYRVIGVRNKTECVKDGKYVIGSVVMYSCKQYYDLKGPRFRTCTKRGQWKPLHTPFCEPICGRKVHQQPLLAGGEPSDIGEWPWQAAVYDAKKDDLLCGGALIREQWVLTAAHCVTVPYSLTVRQPKEFKVHLGKHYRDISKDDEFVQIKQVSHIIVHEEFNWQNFDADIALLKLGKPSVLTSRVQLVCLPSQDHLSQFPTEDRMKGWVAGWGLNASDLFTAVLTEVQLPVMSNLECRQDVTRLTGDSKLTDTLNSNMFCAGHDKDTPVEDYQTVCPGDSGSPLVVLSPVSDGNSWTVFGIVSHYFSNRQMCSMRLPGQFGVFTRVSRFIRWIEMALWNVISSPSPFISNAPSSYKSPNVNASSLCPHLEESDESSTCPNSFLRDSECQRNSRETGEKTRNATCRLCGPYFGDDINAPGPSWNFFYDSALIPDGYVFAMATNDEIRFLRKLNGSWTFPAASSACEADGRGHLVADDRGRAWHDRIVLHMGSEDTWLGADDRDEDGAFTWVEGRFLFT